MKTLFFPLFFLFTSCGIYRSQFDCPAGRGVRCTPVDEILDRIVEKDQGEDLFVTDRKAALLLQKEQEQKIEKTKKQKKQTKKTNVQLIQTKSREWKLLDETREKEP